MKELYGINEGGKPIENNTALFGTINGATSVWSGVTLNLHGTINGNLLLKDKSTVNLHGTVNGDVINDGGELKVFGTINGNLQKRGGTTSISQNANINGEIVGEN